MTGIVYIETCSGHEISPTVSKVNLLIFDLIFFEIVTFIISTLRFFIASRFFFPKLVRSQVVALTQRGFKPIS